MILAENWGSKYRFGGIIQSCHATKRKAARKGGEAVAAMLKPPFSYHCKIRVQRVKPFDLTSSEKPPSSLRCFRLGSPVSPVLVTFSGCLDRHHSLQTDIGRRRRVTHGGEFSELVCIQAEKDLIWQHRLGAGTSGCQAVREKDLLLGAEQTRHLV